MKGSGKTAVTHINMVLRYCSVKLILEYISGYYHKKSKSYSGHLDCMVDAVLNPGGLFSLYDVTGYNSMLKSAGYRILPLLTM